tara:strand:- start:1 stop:225 length:225 start_codon:yes stop_codon:yes gene_type:complete
MKVGDVRETKKRSFVKTFVWRIIAILNSFTVLTLNMTDEPLKNALIMNLTGFVIYFSYERLCNKISWGRKNESR